MKKGQATLEFGLVVFMFVVLLMGMVDVAGLAWDLALASNSARNAAHEASITIDDGSGTSCHSRATDAAGDPPFIMTTSKHLDIYPCDTDPHWVAPSGDTVTATWYFTYNPPFVLFGITLHPQVKSYANFR